MAGFAAKVSAAMSDAGPAGRAAGRRHAALWPRHGARRRQSRTSRRMHGRSDRTGRGRQIDASEHPCRRAPDSVADASTFSAATWRTSRIARPFARASLICRRGWAGTSIRTSASRKTSSSSPGCSGNPAPSGNGGLPSLWRAPGLRRLPIGKRRNYPAACGRSSACAAR